MIARILDAFVDYVSRVVVLLFLMLAIGLMLFVNFVVAAVIWRLAEMVWQ